MCKYPKLAGEAGYAKTIEKAKQQLAASAACVAIYVTSSTKAKAATKLGSFRAVKNLLSTLNIKLDIGLQSRMNEKMEELSALAKKELKDKEKEAAKKWEALGERASTGSHYFTSLSRAIENDTRINTIIIVVVACFVLLFVLTAFVLFLIISFLTCSFLTMWIYICLFCKCLNVESKLLNVFKLLWF